MAEVEQLKQTGASLLPPPALPDPLRNVREAAQCLHLQPEEIRKA